MGRSDTLVEEALKVLSTSDPVEKARLGDAVATRWLQGDISVPFHPDDDLPVPDRPARSPNVRLVTPSMMPKLGRGGSLQSRQAMLHSLVHTESWAIDLSWDIIARFGRQESMPRDFFTDFVKVAQDEGRHFKLLAARLEELGSFYGAFPAHDGLWDSAIQTCKDLSARLAVEHCVHEARGLDVLPATIARFRNGGDECTANLLQTVVYPEEITHCAAGVKWFKYLCQRKTSGFPYSITDTKIHSSSQTGAAEEHSGQQIVDSEKKPSETLGSDNLQKITIQTFHTTVRKHFRGTLKPPFNIEARKAAGFGPEWYEPLAVREI
ncbi:hypothetical protein AXF42_Ash014762 [Apostasia shenzhenica]|uniref:DUF455 domain-containing protein n=1 Tax=Apostasia shenzhenica TaxID=1088818 RepID=A0A2H9ZWB7_9ASPA|nr:hypothetical protein AXF42_Ash014762 [Apostasia shenzhenica]